MPTKVLVNVKLDLMMVDLTSTASPDFVTTLTHAVAAFRDRSERPSAKEVVNALLQEER